VGAAHQRRYFDRHARARRKLRVVEVREDVDRERADALEVEVHVVPRQLELLQVRAHGLGRIAVFA
jgi:hypothetical protein